MSDALFDRIQRYTKTHAACTAAVADWPAFFNDPAQGLSKSASADAVADCKYLLWQEPTFNGLGNQLLSLVSAFVYALLTDRTLLISPAAFNARLLCNPFPHSSWRPPSLSSQDFDLMAAVARNHMVGRMEMDDGARGGDEEQRHPNAAFSDLSCRANVSDLEFYCSKVQRQISAIRFLGLDTEEYIVPALYFVPEFDAELERLFPDRLPLMHVGRYLLHPANYLWEEITRAFRAYLAPYQHRVGIQIRDFTTDTMDEPQVIQRTMQCALNISKGLPPLMEHARWKSIMNEEVAPTALEQQWLDRPRDKAYEGSSSSSSSPRSIGVLVASLKRSYQDAIRDAYVEGVPLGGHDVAVNSLSHESGQTYGEERQLELALKEMWLLSMCDLLMVSDSSTFGYMAAGLAGVSPFSLNIVRRMGADWDVNGRPECEVTTPEPCYLSMLEAHQRQIQCPGEPPKSPVEMSPKVKYCPNYRIGIALDSPFRIPPSKFSPPHSPTRIPPIPIPPSAFPLPHFPFRISPSAFPLPHSPFRMDVFRIPSIRIPPFAFPLPLPPFRISPAHPFRISPSALPLPRSPFRDAPLRDPSQAFPLPYSPFRVPPSICALPRSPIRIPPPHPPTASPHRIPPSAFLFGIPPSAFPLPPSPLPAPPSAFPLPRFPFLIPPSAFPFPHPPLRIPRPMFPPAAPLFPPSAHPFSSHPSSAHPFSPHPSSTHPFPPHPSSTHPFSDPIHPLHIPPHFMDPLRIPSLTPSILSQPFSLHPSSAHPFSPHPSSASSLLTPSILYASLLTPSILYAALLTPSILYASLLTPSILYASLLTPSILYASLPFPPSLPPSPQVWDVEDGQQRADFLCSNECCAVGVDLQ
ncbi:unnamed protein product [Closterium sp. Yama58-4]|nr:unnamed protein product [Closterium sp. Yama58-4]